MHELTVALQIRSAVESELEADPAPLVATSVHVQIGALTGIVPEALEFAWPHAIAGSEALETAGLEIEWVDTQLLCHPCAETRTIVEQPSLRCPVCRSPDVEVIGGDELDIVAVDVRERVSEMR